MNSLDKQYKQLLSDILENGITKSDRTGVGTKSLFGYTIRHDMKDGFPLLTSKKMFWKGIVAELIWFLSGSTCIKYLVDNEVNIWVDDCYKKYVKNYPVNLVDNHHFINPQPLSREDFIEMIKTDQAFADKHGDIGPGYGRQWRQWQGYLEMDNGKMGSLWYDQIKTLINDLKINPDSRRLLVSAWNVATVSQCTLPPCHYSFQCYTRDLTFEEKLQWVMKNTDVEMENLAITERAYDPSTPTKALSLLWNQRSCDFLLGGPFNIASYALLMCLIAKEVNMVPDQLIGNLGDMHLYLNHLEQAKQQLEAPTFSLPSIRIADKGIFDLQIEDIELLNYQSADKIVAPLNT